MKFLKKIGIAALGLLFFAPLGVALASPSSVDRLVDHIEPLIKTDYIKAQYFTATSTTATSTLPLLSVQTALNFFGTFANSLDDLCTAITGGSGLCDGTDAAGSGNVATSSAETSGRIPFWTSTAATPAALSGGSSNLTWNDTNNLLTVQNASTTGMLTVGNTINSTFNIWMNQTNGGYWLDTYGAFTTGLLRDAGGALYLRTGGTNRLSVQNSGASTTALSSLTSYFGATATTTITAAGEVVAPSGTVADPSIVVGGTAGGPGLYLNAANTLGISNGTAGFSWDGNAVYPNSDGARTLGINGTNDWLYLFANNSLVGNSSTTNATSTNLDVTGLLTFNGVTASTWAAFCTAITGGAGLCDGTDATGAGGSAAVATSTNETAGNLAYWTSTNGTPALLGQVATGTLAATSPVTVTAGRSIIGGSGTIAWDFSVANTWTGLQQFTAASTTRLSCYGPCYFGATATSSFATDGALTLATPLLTSSGGTGLSSWTQGDIPYYTSGTALSKLAKDTNATRYLSNQGASNAPSWNQVNLTNGVTGTLPYDNGGTGTTTAPVGQLLYGGSTAYQSVATSSATCTGASGVTCTTFTIVGSGGTTIALSSIPNSSLANSTISGIALGSNLANLSATDSTLTFSGTYNGGTARTIGLNLGNANTWTAKQNFYGAASTTLLSAHWLKVGATASTTIDTAGNVSLPAAGTLTIPGLTSALLVTDGNGLFAEYAGSSCTNQVVTAISALGAATCTTINGNYLDLTANYAWTGTHDFGGGGLEIPNAASPTLGAAGRVALDTTSNNLVVATSTSGHFVAASATTTLAAFVVASTSPDFVSGGIIPIPAHFLQEVAIAVICKVDGGTSQQIFFSDGTNDTNTVTCTTTETQFALTSNNTWNAYEAKNLEFSTKSGSPDYLTVRLIGYRVSN